MPTTTTSSVTWASDDDYIRLGPDAAIPATLTSNVAVTAFRISGVHTPQDVILPVTNIAKVTLPLSEVTITARANCYPDIVNHIQIGRRDGDLEIDFTFSNADRRPNCEDAVGEEDVRAPSSAVPPGTPKLAWVIANSSYVDGWPALDFVENDKSNMAALLSRSGFQVITSFNVPRQQLLIDENRFLQRLMDHPWSSIIVYISGHGIGLGGQNYFVPADAPAATSIVASDLFAISRIQQVLRRTVDAGSFAIILVDACRSETNMGAHSMVAADNQGILVNYSTSPGKTSFDGDHGMSAWTERFVTLANSYPWLDTAQLVMYADRYTKWQSTASLRVQTPVLYGRFPAHVPPMGPGEGGSRAAQIARLTQAGE